jgi:hypothetical protein
MRKALVNTYSSIKLAQGQKKVRCVIRLGVQTVKFLRALRNSSVIYGYSCIPGTNKVSVYLRYFRNKQTTKHFKLISKPGHRRSINFKNSYKYLKKINVGNSNILSTSNVESIQTTFLIKNDKEYKYLHKINGEHLLIT